MAVSVLPRCICEPLEAMMGRYDPRCSRHIGIKPPPLVTKVCAKCKTEKFLTEFSPRNDTKGMKARSFCDACGAAAQKKWAQANREKRREYANNLRRSQPERTMFISARKRAKADDLAFTITLEDITIPEFCPALGLRLEVAPGRRDNSPSLDRTNPALGYVPGNVRVISWRANSLKKDATMIEARAIADYMERELSGPCAGTNGGACHA